MDAVRLANVIRRAQARDTAAFDELVEAYSGRLYGYFYRLTGSRHNAEDLLQDLFVRLVRMIGDYQHDGRFDGWLFRIATNLVRDQVRRQRWDRTIELPGSSEGESCDGVGAMADDSLPPPDERLETVEAVERLQQAVESLPDGEREVIMLRHFSQLPFREIAEMMGTPLGTALARAHRGLGRLRELMGAVEPTQVD